MQEYYFHYKRNWFWHKEKVVGHKLENNAMILWKKDGSLLSIAQWDRYSMRLESDWVTAVKKNAEEQTGVDFKIRS